MRQAARFRAAFLLGRTAPRRLPPLFLRRRQADGQGHDASPAPAHAGPGRGRPCPVHARGRCAPGITPAGATLAVAAQAFSSGRETFPATGHREAPRSAPPLPTWRKNADARGRSRTAVRRGRRRGGQDGALRQATARSRRPAAGVHRDRTVIVTGGSPRPAGALTARPHGPARPSAWAGQRAGAPAAPRGPVHAGQWKRKQRTQLIPRLPARRPAGPIRRDGEAKMAQK